MIDREWEEKLLAAIREWKVQEDSDVDEIAMSRRTALGFEDYLHGRIALPRRGVSVFVSDFGTHNIVRDDEIPYGAVELRQTHRNLVQLNEGSLKQPRREV